MSCLNTSLPINVQYDPCSWTNDLSVFKVALLDGQFSADRLKISDFGLSTVFRHLGKERKLCRRCGTPPYIAPEVRLYMKCVVKVAEYPVKFEDNPIVLFAIIEGLATCRKKIKKIEN